MWVHLNVEYCVWQHLDAVSDVQVLSILQFHTYTSRDTYWHHTPSGFRSSTHSVLSLRCHPPPSHSYLPVKQRETEQNKVTDDRSAICRTWTDFITKSMSAQHYLNLSNRDMKFKQTVIRSSTCRPVAVRLTHESLRRSWTKITLQSGEDLITCLCVGEITQTPGRLLLLSGPSVDQNIKTMIQFSSVRVGVWPSTGRRNEETPTLINAWMYRTFQFGCSFL